MYPLEDVDVKDDGEVKRKLIVFPKDEEREEIVARILENANKERLNGGVWATPGLLHPVCPSSSLSQQA